MCPARVLVSSFYKLKEGRVTCIGDLWSRPFLPESGENSRWFLLQSTVGHDAECGHRPWEPCDRARGVSLSCGASRWSGSGCRARCPSRLVRRGAEGAADGGLVPVNGRTVFEGHCPCLPRVLQRRKYEDLVAQGSCSVRHVRIARHRSTQCRE